MNKDDKYDSDKLRVKPLEGSKDYAFWKRNARAYLTRYDPLLLGLKESALGNSNAAITKWREHSAQAKGTITLLLSEAVQIRAIQIIDDDEKTAYDLWTFLESTYTASNEQAVQNLRVKLDRLVYVEGTDWDDHLNEFNSIIAQLAVQNVEIGDNEKKSLIIRSLPESMSIISTIAAAQGTMTINDLDALVRADLDRKKNPHNQQGKSKDPLKANSAQHMGRNPNNGIGKKKSKCHFCGNRGHFKHECRKFKEHMKQIRHDRKNRGKNGRGNGNGNRNGYGNGQGNRNGYGNGQGNRNGNGNGGGQNQNFGQNNGMNNQSFDMQGLVTALQAAMSNNGQMAFPKFEQPPPQHPFGGFMAKLKFKSTIASVGEEEKTPDALIDSGATHHFFRRRSAFMVYTPMKPEDVKGATGLSKVVGKGLVKIPIGNDGMVVKAYHTPMFDSNILSVRLLGKSFDVLFSEYKYGVPCCALLHQKNGRLVHMYPLKDGLYPMPLPALSTKPIAPKANSAVSNTEIKELERWHRILGHPHGSRIQQLRKVDATIPWFSDAIIKQFQCIPCLTAKTHRAPIRSSTRGTSRPLELVHLDISGKVNPPSIEGFYYTVVLLDDFSAKSDVFLLNAKSELFDTLHEYKARCENELQVKGNKLTNLRLDRAGENFANKVKQFCAHHGIGFEPSPSYAPQSNGAAERLVQEHWMRARVMMFAAKFDKNMWGHAIIHANWLRNRLPASRINGEVPIQRWLPETRVNYLNLLEFGTPGFAYIYRSDTAAGKKFLPRSVFGHFVGMESDTRLIKVFIPHTKAFSTVRRSDFRKYEGTALPGFETLLDGIARQLQDERANSDEATSPDAYLANAFASMHLILPRCLAPKKKKCDPNVPRSFAEACEFPGWRKAIYREFNALVERGTWEYVKLERGMSPVKFTWVFKIKPLDAEGKLFMEKARCCVRGDQQLEYVDYDPTNIYAPVASHDSIRMLLSVAAGQNLSLEGADVSNAYLYGNLDVPIIMEQPTDSSQQPKHPGQVVKLIKSMYGAKQAGQIWGSVLHLALHHWGFTNSRYDERIYFKTEGTDFIILAIVVDDLAFASNSTQLMHRLKTRLRAQFQVKLFGKLSSFVGWNISQRQDGIKVNQLGYVKQMLQDYGLDKANGVTSPLPLSADLMPRYGKEASLNIKDHKLYRSMIGSLMYLAVCTRPDISFSVAVLARQVHDPADRHLRYVKRFLRYVAGTASEGIFYPRSSDVSLRSFRASADADWGGCKETRRSTSGWIVAINGAPVVWRTRKQTAVATSTAEAEYIALYECTKHVSWLRKLWWEITTKKPWLESMVLKEPTELLCDSSAAEALAKNNQVSARAKHMDLKYHFVKKALEDGIVHLSHVESAKNPSDILTKTLALPTFLSDKKLVRVTRD